MAAGGSPLAVPDNFVMTAPAYSGLNHGGRATPQPGIIGNPQTDALLCALGLRHIITVPCGGGGLGGQQQQQQWQQTGPGGSRGDSGRDTTPPAVATRPMFVPPQLVTRAPATAPRAPAPPVAVAPNPDAIDLDDLSGGDEGLDETILLTAPAVVVPDENAIDLDDLE